MPDGHTKNKILFIIYVPDECGIHEKMLYTSSKAGMTSAFDNNSGFQVKDKHFIIINIFR